MRHGDTIIAISTPPGRGGIGVVRLSGPAAVGLANKLFRSTSDAALNTPNLVVHGQVVARSSGEPIDTALATYFKAPHSYTGEDVVEISCHGSPVVLARVLQLGVSEGARIAEPGEFTLRAFFNRRIDLSQAQAVRDLINAQTVYQARIASRQISGGLAKRLAPAKQTLVDVVVQIESAIEFVEDDISSDASAALLVKLDDAIESLRLAAAGFAFGRFVSNGFDLAIVGRPNVGKSSVFNRLVGRDRAIVTEFPGTTRDTLYESTSIAGVPVRLVDTAGVRETSDLVESIGIGRTREAIADADVVVLVLDWSEKLTEDDNALLASVPMAKTVLLLNKSDLPRLLEAQNLDEVSERTTVVSALTGSGFEHLTGIILSLLSGGDAAERDDIMITDARQNAALGRSLEQIIEARDLMAGGELEEIVVLKLRGALSALGEVTGETLTEDILNQIFSTFCIGK